VISKIWKAINEDREPVGPSEFLDETSSCKNQKIEAYGYRPVKIA